MNKWEELKKILESNIAACFTVGLTGSAAIVGQVLGIMTELETEELTDCSFPEVVEVERADLEK